MASTDARPIPIKNTAYRVTFPILDADGDLVTGAASLDSEVSKDGGTFADCTNEATEIATASGMYYLDLTATEMNADCVAIIVKTATTGAKTVPIVLYPQETGDIKVDIQSAGGTAWNSGSITSATFAAGALDPVWSTATRILTAGTNIVLPSNGLSGITSWSVNITGNLSGSVGSVTGAVGSVTGNVGGNVVGSVASVTSRVTANTDQFNGNSTSVANIAFTTQAIVRCTVTTGSTTTTIATSACTPAGASTDQFKGKIITFDANTTTAALRSQSTDITASTNATNPVFTVTALSAAPASGDTFSIT